jgi:hypothetical protein
VLSPPTCAVWPAATDGLRDCPALGRAAETATTVIHTAALDASTADEWSVSSQDDAVGTAVTGRVTEVPHHRATELDTESTASQQTDGGDDGDDAGDESAGLSEALPTTYPGFTPLYRCVCMTRAQAYARRAELQLGKLPRPHGAATTSKQQPRPARRPPASPDADDVAHAFTPLYHCTFRKQPLPAPASDRRPL